MSTDSAAPNAAAWTAELSAGLRQLIQEDAVGRLRRCDGPMAVLGSEDGVPKLDWVEGVARLLADDTMLEALEEEASQLWQRGIRHIIWAGMGGSIITVRTLNELGLCNRRDESGIIIYPLDSTDPAALNEIVRQIAEAKNLRLPLAGAIAPTTPESLRELLQDVMMVGVSMGMTSEEPITHLAWFTALLEEAGLQPAEHLLVMTLPGSYLDRFAVERHAPSRALQLDGGTGTPGRMSAPTTRVFLLPAALYLARLSNQKGRLRAVLHQAWQEHNLVGAADYPADHPFVGLAAALSDTSSGGACRLLLSMPADWRAIIPWVEQLMEESLGKDGKGVIVFDDQPLAPDGSCYRPDGIRRVRVVTDITHAEKDDAFVLCQPYLSGEEPEQRLAGAAASFLGWQLSMALFGYLHRITFAGQPAVEDYKARARALRVEPDPLQIAASWGARVQDSPLTLLAPPTSEMGRSPGAVFSAALQQAVMAADASRRLGYLDLTMNGELPPGWASVLMSQLHMIGNTILGVPVKLRRAPAAYHSTEQCEMDGPPNLVSLRLLVRDREESILGAYTDTFLRAQAVGTWQAMVESGRSCFLLIIDGSPEQAIEPLYRFFQAVAAHLRAGQE